MVKAIFTIPRLIHWRSLRFWLPRTLILWGLLSLIAPENSRAPLQSPQQVITHKPQVCVHTRLNDEVHEWKIQRSLQLTREMGADTIVEFFPWAYFEPEKGQFRWDQADKIIRHAENQGIQVIARIGFVPYWARPDIESDFSTLNYLPIESIDEFANFAATFAARYAGTINHIIIWNEPNLAFEWGYRQVDPAGYVDLLKVAYPAVKAANPNVVVLAGALAPTLEPEGSPHGLDDLIYLEKMYAADAAPYFDALAVHTYGFTLPADAPPDAQTLNFRRVELLRKIMLRYDDTGTPVYITESGWNDNERWTKAVRPAQRAAYTIAGFRWAEEEWPWVEKLCVWALRYPAPTYSYPDNFTLITTNFEIKPLYYAIQDYALNQERSGALWLPPPGGS